LRLKFILAVAFLIATIILISILIGKRDPLQGISQKVNFGILRGPHTSLIYIALDRGYFKQNGLDVSIKEYETGYQAFDALLTGDVDIATATEFVHVTKSFGEFPLQIITTINTAEDQAIIARRDLGIKEIKDLTGRKIGAGWKGSSGFFLETFLTSKDVPINAIVPINLLPSEMDAAISSGKVDAISTFSPNTDRIKSLLGANAISWPSQNSQACYFLLTAKGSFIQSHEDMIQRILRSLIEAEQYLKNDENDARKIIEKRLNMSHKMLLSIWPQYSFRVRLDQDLLILMEAEAQWLIRNRLAGSMKMPNYFKQIYIDGLNKIEPNAVGVIH